MTDRPMLTFTEAAHAAGVDRRTIRRWKDAGKLPDAVLVDGVWRVPVENLLAAGAVLHAPSPPDEPEHEVEPGEVERLRAEVETYRRRAEVAEAVAAERERALDDVRLALRALTEGTPPPTPTGDVGLTPAAPAAPVKRRWWSRR